MFIDIHVHTCRPRHPAVTRYDGTIYPTPERLLDMMNEADLDRAVLMSVVSPECRCTLVQPEETLSIAGQHPDRLIPFCSFDPRNLLHSTKSDFRPLLQAYREMGCKGVGEYIPNLPLDDPLNLNFFAQVEEIGLPLTFHLAPQQGGYYGLVDGLGLPRLEKVLAAFPRLVFLGHSQPFWAEISADLNEAERMGYPKGKVRAGRLVELMRAYPNLHGDLSAGSGFNAISRDPEFGYQFLEEFQDRLYFGTDIANDPQELPIVPYFHELREKQLISPEAFERITWQNADRLLDLGLQAQS